MVVRVPANLLTLLVLVALLSGCKGKATTPVRKVRVSPEVSFAPEPKIKRVARARRASLKKYMEEKLEVAEEMQRRATGDISMKGPAMRMLGVVSRVPAKGYPASFQTFLGALRDRLKILQDSTKPRRDFNLLVESCLACHRIYYLKALPVIHRLKVPAKGDSGATAK